MLYRIYTHSSVEFSKISFDIPCLKGAIKKILIHEPHMSEVKVAKAKMMTYEQTD